MATIQLKRGSSTNLESVKAQLKAGEPLFLTDKKQLAVFDGESINIISRDAKSHPVALQNICLPRYRHPKRQTGSLCPLLTTSKALDF